MYSKELYFNTNGMYGKNMNNFQQPILPGNQGETLHFSSHESFLYFQLDTVFHRDHCVLHDCELFCLDYLMTGFLSLVKMSLIFLFLFYQAHCSFHLKNIISVRSRHTLIPTKYC